MIYLIFDFDIFIFKKDGDIDCFAEILLSPSQIELSKAINFYLVSKAKIDESKIPGDNLEAFLERFSENR